MLGYYLDEDAEHSLPKNLGSAVIFLLFLAWCTTSISIGATGITTAFGMIVVALLFAIFIMIIGTYGVEGARPCTARLKAPPITLPTRLLRTRPNLHFTRFILICDPIPNRSGRRASTRIRKGNGHPLWHDR